MLASRRCGFPNIFRKVGIPILDKEEGCSRTCSADTARFDLHKDIISRSSGKVDSYDFKIRRFLVAIAEGCTSARSTRMSWENRKDCIVVTEITQDNEWGETSESLDRLINENSPQSLHVLRKEPIFCRSAWRQGGKMRSGVFV